jgi:hypothetical protein
MTDTLVLLDQSLQDRLKAQHEEEREILRKEIRDEKDDKKKLREEFTDARNDLKAQIEKSNSRTYIYYIVVNYKQMSQPYRKLMRLQRNRWCK